MQSASEYLLVPPLASSQNGCARMYTQIYIQKCVFVKKFAISVGHKALFIVKLRDPIQNIARIIIKRGFNWCK